MGSRGESQCQMKGCRREATETMAFRRHEDVDVCAAHYRRNRHIRYLVLFAIPLALALAGLALYWFVL
ncbi:hypothetical protein [Natrononativus amylolyticus]|uniref:hypothetical protein n=1 Tax=Natrononativus amylolyticus TaxID=2963434 RepID=UPI0020CDC3A5|nr:hypothetical protein [Natrononativus amylolyticus]